MSKNVPFLQRSWLLLLFALPIALACTSDRPTTPGPPTGTAAGSVIATPTTISWAFWGDPAEVSIDQSIVRLFEKEHPEVHVKARWTDYNRYQSQFGQWMQSSDPPDIAFLSDIPAYVPSGNLADLTPMIQADRYDLTDFYPGLLDLFRYDGHIYGIRRDNDTKVIFYNKSLFDAASVPYPQPGWSWQDLRRAALTLSSAGPRPQYGVAFETQSWWRLWVWQSGGEIYDDPQHPTHATINSPSAVNALRFLQDLIYTDKVTPPATDLSSSERIGSLFASSQLAMAFGNHALMPLLASTAGLRWGAVGLPVGVQQANYFGGAGYVIGSRSAHKQAAWTFLKWLVGSRGEAVFTETGLIVPSRISVGNSNLFLHPNASAAGGEAAEIGRTFLNQTALGRGLPAFPGSTEIANAIDDGLQPIWTEGADPQAVTDALVPRIDAMLGGRR